MERNMKPKCIWTGRRDERAVEVTLSSPGSLALRAETPVHVLPEYEQQLREFNSDFARNEQRFLYGIFGTIFMIVFLVLVGLILTALTSLPDSILIISAGLAIILFGGIIYRYPYSTPQTVKWLGIEKAVKVTRWCGIGTITFGAALIIHGLL